MKQGPLDRNLTRLLRRAYEPVVAPPALRARCLAAVTQAGPPAKHRASRAKRNAAVVILMAAASTWLLIARNPRAGQLVFADADGRIAASGTQVAGRATPRLTSEAGVLVLEPDALLAVRCDDGADVEVLGGAVHCVAAARAAGGVLRLAVAGSRLSPSPDGAQFEVLLVEDVTMRTKSKKWLIGAASLAAGTAAVAVHAGTLQWDVADGGLLLAAGQTATRAPGGPVAATPVPLAAVSAVEPEQQQPTDEQDAAVQRTPAGLSAEQLRQMLCSSVRLDQIRAIDQLLADATPEAAQLLAESLLDATDPVLAAMLAEALTRLVAKQPELAAKLACMFMDALGREPADAARADAAGRGLVALGVAAVDRVGAFLVNRATAPEAAGRAAWALAQLSGEHREAVRQQVRNGLQGAIGVLADPAATEAEREGTRQKTGTLAWLASQRAAAEHDQLAEALVESLVRTGDEAQAGTLVWGLDRLKGLGLAYRLRAAGTLLHALPGQSKAGIAQQYVRAVKQLALASGEPTAFTPVIDEVATAYANVPQIAKVLAWLRTELGLR